MQQYTLARIAELLGAELIGDGDLAISRIATLEKAVEGEISFLANKKYRAQLESTDASAVIMHPAEAPHFNGAKLLIADPYVAYAKLAQIMDTTPASAHGIHPSAVVAEDAVVSASASIGANAVIESGVWIGDDVQVGANCYIGADSQIGKGTKLWANVSIYHNVTLGEACLVQSGAVIGGDGFGYANEKGQWVKIPQIGGVVIGNRVEIGANTTIDRGALEDTVIHDNVIIDNQCQIAHNVEIGEGTAIAGCAVIAGSTKIGKYCQLGGMSGVTGHSELCDGVILTGMTMVISSITEPGVYSSGMPHTTNREWRRNMAHLRTIGDMNKRIKALESQLGTLVKVDN